MDTKGKSFYELEQVASERQVSFKGGLRTKTIQVWGQRNTWKQKTSGSSLKGSKQPARAKSSEFLLAGGSRGVRNEGKSLWKPLTPSKNHDREETQKDLDRRWQVSTVTTGPRTSNRLQQHPESCPMNCTAATVGGNPVLSSKAWPKVPNTCRRKVFRGFYTVTIHLAF